MLEAFGLGFIAQCSLLIGGVRELDAGEAILPPPEVRERVVELRGADRPRPDEVVLGPLDGFAL